MPGIIPENGLNGTFLIWKHGNGLGFVKMAEMFLSERS